jgi:hypothetical protein
MQVFGVGGSSRGEQVELMTASSQPFRRGVERPIEPWESKDMATTSSSALAQNLEQLVATFVRSSQELVLAAVTQAMLAPCSSAAPTTKQSKRGKTSKRAKPSRRRTADEVAELGERFYAALCTHPGELMVVLAAKLDASPRDLQRSVMLLKRAGRVRSVGQRGSTRYFPVNRTAKAA